MTGTKYSAAARKVDLVHYESAMMVHNITEGDYAKYVCIAENELGTDTTVVTLDGTSECALKHSKSLEFYWT